MEITPEILDSLSPEDLERAAEYKKLREKAKDDAFNIRDTYVFRMGEKWRVINRVLATSTSAWVLTYDGVWKLCSRDPTENIVDFLIRVEPDSLFDFFKTVDEAKRVGDQFVVPACYSKDIQNEDGSYNIPDCGWCCVTHPSTNSNSRRLIFQNCYNEFMRFLDWTAHTPKYTIQVPPESYVNGSLSRKV